LTKKTWLVGGTGSFNSYKQNETFIFQFNGENIEIQRNIKEIELSPKVGYFIMDKLVVGLSSSFTSEKSESTTITGNAGGGSSNSYSFSIGPFARYYLLKKDLPYNILLEANYQFGSVSQSDLPNSKGKLNRFSFFVGPEIFFNSSVGIELLVGYKTSTQKMDNPNFASMTKNGFQVGVGFQIHLEKL
jgi:hypothetical protein